MANSNQLELLSKGPERWNEWRRTHRGERPDLRGAYLREADLSEFDLKRADLSGAVLMAAKFDATDLRDAILSDCDLRFANLGGARLRGARFDGARGVPRRIARAAAGAPSPWRRRPSALLPLSAVAATVFFVVGYLAASGALSGAAATALAPAADPAAGLDGPERLAHKLRGVRFPGWDIAAVDLDDGVLTMRVDRGVVSDDVYLPAIGAVCGALLESDDQSLSEVRVVDRSGSAGWLYARPDNCRVLLQSPLAMMRLVVAADSRPLGAQQP